MTADEIAKMDYKQLRNAVIELNDNYIKLKRMLDDTLNNLDTSNLATTFRKEIDGYSSEFKITAKEISSKVEHIEDNLEQYSTIKQTADKIEMAVNENREYTDDQTQQLQSTFTMTASQISTNVVKVQNNVTKNYSSIKQTADMIELIVGEVRDKDNYFTANSESTIRSSDGYKESKLCKIGDKYYYYNTISRTWKEYKEGIESAMIHTSSGFYFTNNVRISGDLITEGTIRGIDIAGVRFWGEKPSISDLKSGSYFKIVSNVGDIGLFDVNTKSDSLNDNEGCIWGVSQRDPGRAIRMYSYGQEILGYNKGYNKVYPMGTWDFSSCNVVGLKTE